MHQTERTEPLLAFELPGTARLYHHWQARRGDGLPPPAIEMERLCFALGEPVARGLALIDVLRRGEHVRFRFGRCGATLAAWHGTDMTGRFLDQHPEPAIAARLDWAWRRVVDAALPLHGRRSARVHGRRRDYEFLVLPLGEGRRVDRLLALQLDLPAPAMPRPALLDAA